MTNARLEIDEAQYLRNIHAVIDRIGPSQLMLVMKDGAYGHGLAWAARTASTAGVRWFGSYDVAGAKTIRGVSAPDARIFAWVTSPNHEIADALMNDVDLGVGSAEYLRRVLTQARDVGVRARVHLKIDTGLHRNGIRPEDWADVVSIAREAEKAGYIHVVGVWSHLAEASDAQDDAAKRVFDHAVDVLVAAGGTPEILHLTASAASWWRPELRGSLSRVGAFCFGVRSADGPELEGVRPIARLVAPVVRVNQESVTVGIGSFDGIPSTLEGASVGTPAGARELLRVNSSTVDVASWPGAAEGDSVVLFGPGGSGEQSATSLAERIDTVGEEILTRLSPRLKRVTREFE